MSVISCGRIIFLYLFTFIAEHIKQWMDPSAKPCEDFYEYSCGRGRNAKNDSDIKVQCYKNYNVHNTIIVTLFTKTVL